MERHRGRRPRRHHRQPRQAPGLRLPLQRDLRRHPLRLGLRPARRRAQGERPPAVVAVDGAEPRRHRRPRLRGHPRRARCGSRPVTSRRSVDPLIECPSCHKRFRADHLEEAYEAKHGRPPASLADVNCPNCGTKGAFTEPRQFNGLLKTYLGPVESEEGLHYLRPETAQGIFVNFLNVMTSARKKPPFGIAQIGKSFRNEITPGQLHLPHPRVRADGDGVLRRAGHRRGVARVLAAGSAGTGTSTSACARRTCASSSTRRRSSRTTRSAPSTSSTASASAARSSPSSRASPTAPTST